MRFAIFGNADKSGLKETLIVLLESLENAGMEYALDEALAPVVSGRSAKTPGRLKSRESCLEGADMLMALGGDGTILAAARAVGRKGTPILGVNLGKLGFLAELAPGEIVRAVGDILAGRYVVDERLVIEVRTTADPAKVFPAMNDIVLDKSRSSRVIDIETHIDGAFAVTYRGDGVIVSTPTGSTAYALSNGGPIVTPGSDVIGITPIAPHSLSGRPLIVPASSVIRIAAHAESDEILLAADGQEVALLAPPAEITVRKAEYTVRLVRRTDRSYFDLLRAKLHWGRDARTSA
jgi:NAD+ kinase